MKMLMEYQSGDLHPRTRGIKITLRNEKLFSLTLLCVFSSLQELFSKMAEISALNYDATDDSDEEFFSDEDPFEICSSNN